MERWTRYFQKVLRDMNIISTKITEVLGEELEKDIERTERE
jgi:hypothetical protein